MSPHAGIKTAKFKTARPIGPARRERCTEEDDARKRSPSYAPTRMQSCEINGAADSSIVPVARVTA